jgi:thiol-disulfide isomerase/thioredoxin
MTNPFALRRILSWSALALTGVIALGAGLYFGGFAEQGNVTDLRGNEAGALFGVALPDAKGREQSIGQWKGKVLVVNFWATWCVPCREEMPEFVTAQQEFGPRGLQFVGIAIDDVAKVEAFAAELGLNYPVLIGGYGAIELSRTFGNRLGALPFTIIVDRAGRVSHTQLGPIKDAQLRTIVSQLL